MDDQPNLVADLMAAVQAEKRLSDDLANYVDQWVAVRDHAVVAHAPTLSELLAKIDADKVESVFQVVEQGTASFF
jgi:hypothetical protein